MPKAISYAEARANLATLCDEVVESCDAVIIHRRGARDVALIAAEELKALIETAQLLRSSNNTRRLLSEK
jgi:antitoxin YefM